MNGIYRHIALLADPDQLEELVWAFEVADFMRADICSYRNRDLYSDAECARLSNAYRVEAELLGDALEQRQHVLGPIQFPQHRDPARNPEAVAQTGRLDSDTYDAWATAHSVQTVAQDDDDIPF